MPASVRAVADYFLAKRDPNAGDEISNLKIQKLVYYAQGFHLALAGEPLFAERIEAWRFGPVCPTLYHAFKVYGDTNLPHPDGDVRGPFTDTQREILDEVYEVYGQFSAWKLRDLTHNEAPWKDADSSRDSVEITHAALREFFLTRLT